MTAKPSTTELNDDIVFPLRCPVTSTLSPTPRTHSGSYSRGRIVIVGLSLAANLALVSAVAIRHTTGTEQRKSDMVAAPPRGDGATIQSGDIGKAPVGAHTWRSLTDGNLPDVIARLRAAGFPPHLLRVVVTSLVDAQFADRHHEIAEMIRARPWWLGIWGGDGMKMMLASQKLQRDISDKVDELLGPDLGDEYVQASRRFRYGNLPPAKLALLDRINGDYSELANEMKAEAGGVLLDDDKERLSYLSAQNHAEVAQLMTPEELFDYDMHGSPTGWWLRTQLQYLNPTDEEFRAIFKVQHEFMKPFADGNAELWTADMREAMDKADPPLKDLIKNVLSPERFAEYELKTDQAYLATAPFIDRLGLPNTATDDVVKLQRDIIKRADAIRADATLTTDARTAQLAALADEANLRLAGTLGDRGLAAYKTSLGRWMSALAPAPKH